MGKAFECDRCKALYTNNAGYRSTDIYITTTPNNTTGIMDLCPACHEKLRKWWNMEKYILYNKCSKCAHEYSPLDNEPCSSCFYDFESMEGINEKDSSV